MCLIHGTCGVSITPHSIHTDFPKFPFPSHTRERIALEAPPQLRLELDETERGLDATFKRDFGGC